ncbi:unnamed protein product [Discula destructiva]
MSLSNRPSDWRSTQPVVRPSLTPSVRPSMGSDGQYRGAQLPSPRSNTAQDVERYAAPQTAVGVLQQQSLFANPHGIREVSAPPPVRPAASRTRPVSMVVTPTFSNGIFSNINNNLSASGHVAGESSSRLPQMPGAFPGDIAVPYRRPTDLTAHFLSSNESAEHLSSSSETCDSEGETGSNLSTSTDATTVASDIIVGKNDPYTMSSAYGGPSSSSGATTPTQDHYEDSSDQSRQTHRLPHAPILRRAGHKSVLSSGSKTASSSSTNSISTSSHRPTKTASSGSGSLSTRRNSQNGGPNIHIEVHKPTAQRESRSSEAHIQQKIEKVLRDHLNLVEQRKSESREPASTSESLALPAKPSLTVRFAEPAQHKPQRAPNPAPEKENILTKELVLQGKEIHKLELEVEKRDLIIKEKERADVERRLQEERAETERKKQQERANLEKKLQAEHVQAERDKQRERERQNLEIEKRDLQKTQKAEQQERELERQHRERERKEAEKAQRAQEKELVKERQRIEKEKKEMEEDKVRAKKAQEEHDLLHLSFMDQGRILADLKSRFDKQAKTLEATEVERKELQRVKDEFEHKCSDLSKSLSHVSDKERYVVEQVASLQIIKESLQKRVGPLEERATKLSAENSELRAERDEMMKDLKTYLDQCVELEKETKSLIEEKRGFISHKGELEKAKAELRAEVKGLKEQSASLEGHLEARANDYSEHIAVLRNEHKFQMGSLEAHIAGIHTEHQVQLGDLEDQLAGLKGHIDGAHDDLKALESRLADEKAKHNVLAAENERLSIDLEGQKIYAVEQEMTLMTLRDDLSRRSDVIAKLQETNKTLQAEHEELQKLADEIEVRQKTDGSEYKTLRATNDELATKNSILETKNAELENMVSSTKTDLEAQLVAAKKDFEARVAGVEAERAATRSALAAELASKSTVEDTASKISALEQEAAKVPALICEKTALEEEVAKVPALLSEKATLEAKTTELEAKTSELEAQVTQLPNLRSECVKLAEQLAAANKLIEGLTAVQQAAMASPAVTPLSPDFPPPPPSVFSSAPQDNTKPPKVRSRAPSMVRSVSSRTSSSKRSVRDDIALVMVRNPADRGAVQVIRKSDLREIRTGRSRSQPPEKE